MMITHYHVQLPNYTCRHPLPFSFSLGWDPFLPNPLCDHFPDHLHLLGSCSVGEYGRRWYTSSWVPLCLLCSSSDEIYSMGGHECTRPTPKSPSVQSGDGFECLLKRIENLILVSYTSWVSRCWWSLPSRWILHPVLYICSYVSASNFNTI